MTYETIRYAEKNNIATITLNRPEVHNAMNEALMKELTDCISEVSKNKTIRIVILTGNGKSFCAGADLNWMKSMVNYSKEENIEDSRLLLNLYESIYQCPKPVIAKINGHAFGGGIGLFAVCDIALAVPECKFAFSETKLGIIPSVISSYIIKRINGLSHVRRLFITGERFNAEYAERIGLIDFVYPEDKIDEKLQKYISILESSGPNSVKEIKNLINTYEKEPIETYKKFTVEKIAELRISKEGQEGINAFLEKRKSKWSE